MRIVFFTGAGISQESGLRTFRDGGGLWESYPVEDVCSARAWAEAPARVLAFYNERRRAARDANPNAAHIAIADLARSGPHDVAIVTQNIDDLHERAGSPRVIHLHGEVMKSRGVDDPGTLYDCPGDLHIGDLAPDGRQQLRPHVVFFGEAICNHAAARSVLRRADILVVVGTSLAVHPAAGLAMESPARTIYVIDPSPSRVTREDRVMRAIRKPAPPSPVELRAAADELARDAFRRRPSGRRPTANAVCAPDPAQLSLVR